MSCATDLSPTALFGPGYSGAPVASAECGRGEVYPGCGMAGVGWEGYTGYYPAPSQDPDIDIFPRLRPTHGQMRLN